MKRFALTCLLFISGTLTAQDSAIPTLNVVGAWKAVNFPNIVFEFSHGNDFIFTHSLIKTTKNDAFTTKVPYDEITRGAWEIGDWIKTVNDKGTDSTCNFKIYANGECCFNAKILSNKLILSKVVGYTSTICSSRVLIKVTQ